MNKKKLGIGVMALALSMGIMSKPQTNLNLSKLVYAAEEVSEEKSIDRLERLVNEYDDAIATWDYENADSINRETYQNKIEEGRSALKDNKLDNVDTLADEIIEAKKNIGLSEHNIRDSKKALDYLISVAKKLAGSKDTIKEEDITRLEGAITQAEKVSEDVNSNMKDLDKESSDLINLIIDIIDSNDLDPDQYNLSEAELKENIHIIKNESEYKDIKDLIEELHDKNGTLDDNLSKNSKQAVSVSDKIETEEADFRNILSELTTNDHEKVLESNEYKDASKDTVTAYDFAIDTGKALLYKENPTASDEELKNAVESIKAAKVSLGLNDDKNAQISEKQRLEKLIKDADKIIAHPHYKEMSKEAREALTLSLDKAKSALESDDSEKIKKADEDLTKTLEDSEIKAIYDKVKKELADDATYKEKIEKIISDDESFRNTSIFTKAQKTLRDDYIKRLEEAKVIISKENSTDEELSKAEENLTKAKQELDGDLFGRRYEALRARYEKDKSKIEDKEKREEIGKKIEELGTNTSATMDDILALDKELDEAIPKLSGTTTVPKDKGTTTVTKTPSTTKSTGTTKKTPVTTKTISPKKSNSIVRTGIESIVGVAVVLVVAAGALVFTGRRKKDNKGDNDEI